MSKQLEKNHGSTKNVAGLYQPIVKTNQGVYQASIQINVVEACLCVASIVDECICLTCNSYTEPCHGYETGLKGTLAAVVGCALATPSACISTACCTITEACHCFTAGERGRFTTSCTLPSFCGCVISACTDYFIIDLTACTYNVATTRALALAGTGVCITGAGVGNQTFTPNGAIPTGSTANSWIIKIDDCTFKLATSKALAQAGTVDAITALNAPASVSFTATATACDCANGTITFHAGNDGSNYAAANLECHSYSLNPCGVANTLYEFDPVTYNEIQVDVCVTEGQWVLDIDYVGKQPGS